MSPEHPGNGGKAPSEGQRPTAMLLATGSDQGRRFCRSIQLSEPFDAILRAGDDDQVAF